MFHYLSEQDNWYFSYGSNLSKQQMLRRTGSIPISKIASLAHYQFAFRRVLDGNDVFATIVPKQNSTVHGVVYRCSPHAMLQLDHFEGVAEDCYRRASVQATTRDGEILPCIVYIGQAFTAEAAYPSASYWNSILTGAKEHQLSIEYINALTKLAEFRSISDTPD
jgi:gamma-glutamylcyclotransferase